MALITLSLRPVRRAIAAVPLILALAAAPAWAQALPPGVETPLAPSVDPLGTCDFANVTLQAAVEGFWAMPRNAAPARMTGQTQVARYDGMPGASVRGKAKSFRSVKAEYERRVADLSACVVTIQGRPYGLEGMIEAAPADKEATDVEALFRLRDPPEYLSNLRIHAHAYWSMSAWTVVAAGIPSEWLEGHGRDAYRTEQRLRRAGLVWRPLSTAPPAPDPLAAFDVDALIKAGDSLVARARDEADTPVNWGVRALPFFDTACRRGSMLGCGRKGWLMSDGFGGGSPAQAQPYLEKGCAVKDANSCYKLADRMLVGYPSAETRSRAMAMIFQACEDGSGVACGRAADSLTVTTPDTKPDWPRIMKLYERACAKRDSWACLRGGKVYYFGNAGVAKDLNQARNMFALGCTGRGTLMGEACRYAGAMYVAGLGGERVDDLAKLMFKRGCNKNDAASCKSIGLPVP